MDTLASLHAAFWRSPRFQDDLAWLKSGAANPNMPVERWISRRSNAPAIARYGEVLSAAVRERSAEIHGHRDLLEAYWADGPLTLIHGDSHVGNMFFLDGKAGLLDWQVLQRGQGIRDVAYFMMNSLDVELRREHQRALLRRYRDHLLEHGVSAAEIDADRLWQQYRSHSFYVWIAAAVTAGTPGLQPANIVRRGLERAAAALDDLDAFTLLDEIGGAKR